MTGCSGVEAQGGEVASVAPLCNSAEDVTRETRTLGLLLEQRVQGVLISPGDAMHPPFSGFVATPAGS
ncbi:MAG: hypothetical protein ACRDU8_09590 [Egibacteraceae bacterium]